MEGSTLSPTPASDSDPSEEDGRVAGGVDPPLLSPAAGEVEVSGVIVSADAQAEQSLEQQQKQSVEHIFGPKPDFNKGNAGVQSGLGIARSWKQVCVGEVDFDRCCIKPEAFHGKVKIEFQADGEGIPIISFDSTIIDQLSSAWKQSVIFRPLGARIPFDFMADRIRDSMKIKGNYRLSDIPNGFFILKLQSEEDYNAILSDGPWRAYGQYLAVQAWNAKFDPMKDMISKTPVWVRILNLPMLFYEENALMHIISSIGEPVRVDLKTLFAERGRFARISVNVDLSKTLFGLSEI